MKKLVWLFVIVLFAKTTVAQILGTGRYSFGSFDDRGFDSVNLGNLNVRFNVPLVNRPGRGMGFNYSIQYEGKVWNSLSAAGNQAWTPDPQWGFAGLLNGTTFAGYLSHATRTTTCRGTNGTFPAVSYTNYTYHDAFGASHLFNYADTQTCQQNEVKETITGNRTAKDGSGYTLSSDTTQVSSRDGSVIVPATSEQGADNTSITDSNGNTISASGGSSFVDTTGTTALTVAGGTPRTFTYPVALQSDSASSATATVSYRAYTVQTNFGCSGIIEYGATAASLVDRITLADGRFYAFTYEPTSGIAGAVTARLASVTLPTGGVISYAYSGGCSGAGINTDGTVGTLTRTSDGTRTYTHSATSTILKDEKSNQTAFTFVFDSGSGRFFETHRQVYQGSISGTPLQDRVTCYNGVSGNSCDGQALTLPITEMDVNEGFNGLQQSFTKNAYDPSGTLLTSSAVYNGTTLLKSVSNTYNGLGELTDTSQNDQNGTPYTYSAYRYDEGSVTVTSGIPQHGSGGSQRGNLTSTHISAGAVYLNTSASYYDTGKPINSTAMDGGVTSYGYDATQTFVMQTNLPTPSSGVVLSRSTTYDARSGTLLTSTGLNSDQTKINQYDRTLRPVNVTSPNGSVTSYDWFSSPNRVVVSQTMGGGQSATSMMLLDGYGRTSRTALLSTNTWYMTDYCYDASGLLQFKTLPYAAQQSFSTTKQCSGTGTTYAYDALGRVTSVSNVDGTATTTYQGRAVMTTDVNNVQKIVQYDLLGRIAGVCEISSNALAGQSPTTCTANGLGMDIAGTGYVTGYAYSLTNHTTTITQGAQQRIFQTDPAGRTVLVSEPERGQTSYSYSFNGTGLQVVRTRPRANQANASTVTNATMQYDTMSRLTGVAYDDTPAANRAFKYDANQNFLLQGTSNNVKGLLAGAYSGTGTTQTIFQYSYDIMGHVSTMWQCAPSICSTQYTRPAIQLSYDLVGNITNEFDGVTGSIAYGRSPAGEITSVTNQSYTDVYNTPNLVSNTSYGPFGLTGWKLGNSLQQASFYDGLGRKYAQFICPGNQTNGFNCNGELYGDAGGFKGVRVTSFCDTVTTAGCLYPSYDEFNRLTAFNGNAWTYDRWGNRLTQSGSPSVTYTFNSANNRNNSFGYDAAGNQTNDALHSYTYDPEGNVISVDGGSTAQYVYDAANRRVRVQVGSNWTEYLFDPMGQRLSSWIPNGAGGAGNEGRIWMDGVLVATRNWNGKTYFHHTDPLGTERMRTDYTGAIATTSKSAAFGDGFSQTSSDQYGAAQDNLEFAGQDADNESGTQHAGYRQYSSTAGRWMSPDPYDGSYDATNPQSLNRYSYVSNGVLTFTDPSGQFAPGCTGGCQDFYFLSWWLNEYFGPYYAAALFAQNLGTPNASNNQVSSTIQLIKPKPNAPAPPSNAPSSKSKLHNLACGALSSMLDYASDTNSTVGTGGGGSVGVGIGVGLNLSFSFQIVATPSGEAGLTFTGGAGPWIIGIGYVAGGQASISNAHNLADLRGSGIDLGISGGAAYGGSLDYTSNLNKTVTGGSLTAGIAGGGKASTAATYTHTWAPDMFSINCRD